MKYKPLPSGLTVKNSSIQGLGLFATIKIESGIIGIGWIKYDHFPDGHIRTPLGGFINHSDTPNCEKLDHDSLGIIWLKAIRTISSGEELTVKYSFYQV